MHTTFKTIRPAASCWVCRAGRNPDPGEAAPFDWLPQGWRRTRRGFAGTVTICDQCTAAKRHHRRWNAHTLGEED